MSNTCRLCKFGQEVRPGGQRPSPGTVWCAQRCIQMARHRSMQCFVPPAGGPARLCRECKKAKMTRPTGATPQIGHIWCETKRMEMHKQRNMECFE
jgi:hypothetical protein